MTLSEMCILSLIYSYVAVCRLCAVRYITVTCFCLLLSNSSTNICVIFLIVFLFSILCILYFCIVLCIVSPLVLFLFRFFVLAYRPRPPGGNPIVVNK
jgi:hypothetical protein